MPQNPWHIFEQSKIKVDLRIKKGEPKEKKGTFVFTKWQDKTKVKELGRVEVELTRHAFSADEFKAEFVAPAPDDTEDSYLLKCHLEMGTKQFPYGQEWAVWHETIKVTTKRKIDGALTESGFIVMRLRQGEAETFFPMPSSGKYLLLISEPGGFELLVDSPFRFLQWLDGKDKGKERVLEYDVAPCVARIASPPGEGTVPWYVNLPGEGHEVKFEVTSVSHTGDPLGKQDLFIEVNFKNETKRGTGTPAAPDDDYRKERTVTGLSEEKKSNGDKTMKGKVRTGDDAKATFTVYLGKGGGETCEVKAGSTNTVVDAKLTLETWRKLYVQNSHSGTDRTKKAWPLDKRQAVLDAYKEVFIEMELLDDKVYPDSLTLGERCGWHDGEEIGDDEAERVFAINIDGTEWRKLASALAPGDPKKDPLFINVGAVDLLFEVHNVFANKPVTKATPGGTLVLKGSDLSASAEHTLGGLPRKPVYQPKATWKLTKFESGVVTKLGEGDVPAGNITVSASPKSDRGTLKVKVPDDVFEQLKGDPKLKAVVMIDALMAVKDAGAMGVSDGSHSVILNHDAAGDAETNNTVIHEIGHAIGMCGDASQLGNKGMGTIRDRLPDYTLNRLKKSDGTPASSAWSYKEHPRWYDGRGHQGDHCANGLGQSAYDKWGKLDGADPRNLATYKCVIYGQSQFLRTPVKWCDDCKALLKAMDLWVGVKARP